MVWINSLHVVCSLLDPGLQAMTYGYHDHTLPAGMLMLHWCMQMCPSHQPGSAPLLALRALGSIMHVICCVAGFDTDQQQGIHTYIHGTLHAQGLIKGPRPSKAPIHLIKHVMNTGRVKLGSDGHCFLCRATPSCTYLDCCCLACLTCSIWGTDVTARPRFVDDVPRQDGRLVLVHTPIDSVDAVGYGCLVVQVELDDLRVDVELLRMLKTRCSHILHTQGTVRSLQFKGNCTC